MNCKGICNENVFTFTWVIENFTYCWQKNGERIMSPEFSSNAIVESCWRLELYPKGSGDNSKDFLSFYLYKATGITNSCISNIPCNIYFELSFIAVDGSVLVSKVIHKNDFCVGMKRGISLFVKCEEVFRIRKKDFLPGDGLTARCRIWQQNRGVANCGHCFARTRIGVERWLFVWHIKQFNLFQESICEISSVSANKSIMTLKFFPSGGHTQTKETFISVEAIAHDQRLKFLTFLFHLVDSEGNRTECFNDEFTFTEDIKTAVFMFNTFTKEKLIENQNLYLPNGDLQLYCQCAFVTGIVLREIERISCECPSIQKVNLVSDELEAKECSLDSTIVLKQNLESSYREKLLCDTKLKTETGSFPANKFILSTRSPVFKAMFTNDMKEKNGEYVMIEDLDDDTVQRMLQYIYTATVPDLKWDSAHNLYAAADKYEILSLKSKCSSFLKDNLSLYNAFDSLILADRHQDQDLMSSVQDYILNHTGIFSTKEWELFMKTNLQLAANLMHLKLRSGNFNLSDSHRSGRPTTLDNDIIKGASERKSVLDNLGIVKCS
ncbi:TD and POZ domain-containing protein 5 [Trichonephila clavipes]|nr:TD and POZ domain-containing protein 5 [Trichonephila clavipes]